MEFIGHHDYDQAEIRVKMPKFGNVRYTRIVNTMEDYSKKETIIRTKIRDHTSEKGTIGKPCKRIRHGIFDLYSLISTLVRPVTNYSEQKEP